MTEIHWEVALVTAAAVPASLFPILYTLLAHWWRTVSGRAVMISETSTAVLLDLALVAYWFHVEIPAWTRITLYAFIAAGCWQMLGALLNEQLLKRRALLQDR